MHKHHERQSRGRGSRRFSGDRIDIGGTAIKAAIVDVRGDLLESSREPSPRSLSAVHDFAHSLLKRAKGPVCGIGIGCKGVVDATSSLVKSLPGDLHFLEGQLLSEGDQCR